MHSSIASLLHTYGYPVIFILVGLESLGIPLPGETALLTAGAFAALGDLSIIWVVVTAAVGAIVGDNTGYWIGRKGGMPLLHKYGRFLHVTDAKLQRVHAFFARHGPKAVFLGRFIALLRTWAAFLAGVGRMRYRTFTFYNALGGIVWATVVGALGYLFGENLPLLERYMHHASWVAVGSVVIAVAAVVVWRKWRKRNAQG